MHTNRATFRFYAELNDFLMPSRRHVAFEFPFHGMPAVKDTIEALGVPHTEIDLILIDGAAASFSDRLSDGRRVSVYPVFETLDIGPLARLRPRPLRNPRFVLDVHLGRLAAYLRLMGFDASYANDFQDDVLAEKASREGRILLTKDRGLLKRAAITHGYCVRATNPREQLGEILTRFDLFGSIRPFWRCLACNGLLRPVPKAQVKDDLPPRVRQLHLEFAQCQSCGRVYWKGTHYERMRAFIEALGGSHLVDG